MKVKIWLDDIRPEPSGYVRAYSVNQVKDMIESLERQGVENIELNLDHDLGDYAKDGGDGIKLVIWLAETERFYPIKLHTANVVGYENMSRLINRYWPKD